MILRKRQRPRGTPTQPGSPPPAAAAASTEETAPSGDKQSLWPLGLTMGARPHTAALAGVEADASSLSDSLSVSSVDSALSIGGAVGVGAWGAQHQAGWHGPTMSAFSGPPRAGLYPPPPPPPPEEEPRNPYTPAHSAPPPAPGSKGEPRPRRQDVAEALVTRGTASAHRHHRHPPGPGSDSGSEVSVRSAGAGTRARREKRADTDAEVSTDRAPGRRRAPARARARGGDADTDTDSALESRASAARPALSASAAGAVLLAQDRSESTDQSRWASALHNLMLHLHQGSLPTAQPETDFSDLCVGLSQELTRAPASKATLRWVLAAYEQWLAWREAGEALLPAVPAPPQGASQGVPPRAAGPAALPRAAGPAGPAEGPGRARPPAVRSLDDLLAQAGAARSKAFWQPQGPGAALSSLYPQDHAEAEQARALMWALCCADELRAQAQCQARVQVCVLSSALTRNGPWRAVWRLGQEGPLGSALALVNDYVLPSMRPLHERALVSVRSALARARRLAPGRHSAARSPAGHTSINNINDDDDEGDEGDDEDVAAGEEGVPGVEDGDEDEDHFAELAGAFGAMHAGHDGLVLAGPTGIGKTQFVQAVAARAGLPLLTVMPSAVNAGVVGETERNLRATYTLVEQAAAQGLTLMVFFDELDTLFPALDRLSQQSSHDMSKRGEALDVLSAIPSQGAIVWAATNNAQNADPSLAGRVGRVVELQAPSLDDMDDFAKHHVRIDNPEVRRLFVSAAAHGGAVNLRHVADVIKAVDAAAAAAAPPSAGLKGLRKARRAILDDPVRFEEACGPLLPAQPGRPSPPRPDEPLARGPARRTAVRAPTRVSLEQAGIWAAGPAPRLAPRSGARFPGTASSVGGAARGRGDLGAAEGHAQDEGGDHQAPTHPHTQPHTDTNKGAVADTNSLDDDSLTGDLDGESVGSGF